MKLVGNRGDGKHAKNQNKGAKKQEKVFSGDNVELPEEILTEIEAKKLQQAEIAPIKKKRKKRHVALIILLAIVALAGGCTAAYFMWETPPDRDTDGPRVQDHTSPSVDDDTSVSESPTQEPEPTSGHKQGCYTFLVAAYDQTGANTDTILVGRLDTKEGTLNVVSIPRDTLTDVSWANKRVNSILVARGNDPDKFVDSMADLLGFEVDCYVLLDMRAIANIIDTIGGITYNVPVNMNYDDPTQDLYIHINKGEQLLNGEDAVKVMRFRSGYATGDIGRIGTLQDFLMTTAKQMLTLGNIPNLPKILEIVEENVRTDLTTSNISFFVRQFLLLDSDDINFYTLPGWDNMINGASYYITYADEWLQMVNDYINPYYEEITLSNVRIKQYSSTYGMYVATP